MVSPRALAKRFLTPVTLIRMIPISVILMTGIVLSVWTHRVLSDQRDLVVHTHEAIEMAKDVLIGLDDAETGQRGYLLSGDRRYLVPYTRALDRLKWMFASLKTQVSDNAEQTTRVETLRGLMGRKLDELAAAIAARDDVGDAAALKLELAHMQRATMDDIRRVIGDLTEGEKSLLDARSEQVESDENRVRVVAVLIGIASLLTRWAVEIYLSRSGYAVAATRRNDGLAADTIENGSVPMRSRALSADRGPAASPFLRERASLLPMRRREPPA